MFAQIDENIVSRKQIMSFLYQECIRVTQATVVRCYITSYEQTLCLKICLPKTMPLYKMPVRFFVRSYVVFPHFSMVNASQTVVPIITVHSVNASNHIKGLNLVTLNTHFCAYLIRQSPKC